MDKPMRDRHTIHLDDKDHYRALAEIKPTRHAEAVFRRKAYRSVDVTAYMKKKGHDIKRGIDSGQRSLD